MTKWSKALAVVAIGVAAGVLAPGSASAATHHVKPVKQVVLADSIGGSDALASTDSVSWDG